MKILQNIMHWKYALLQSNNQSNKNVNITMKPSAKQTNDKTKRIYKQDVTRTSINMKNFSFKS